MDVAYNMCTLVIILDLDSTTGTVALTKCKAAGHEDLTEQVQSVCLNLADGMNFIRVGVKN